MKLNVPTLSDLKAEGKKADVAIRDLEFTRKKVAQDIKKTVKSAVANAENNYQYDIDKLIVKEAYCGKQVVMKRFRARAKGRAAEIMKPYSNDVGGLNVSLIVLAETILYKFIDEPALSFVPEALEPPKGC